MQELEWAGLIKPDLGPLQHVGGGDGVSITSNAFPEARLMKTGNALLGYLEGRPGVVKILKVEQWKSEGWKPGGERPAPPPEVLDRVAKVPMVLEADPAEKDGLIRDILEAWAECEDDGAWVECEIDYEEASS